jgi:hypothetical protein
MRNLKFIAVVLAGLVLPSLVFAEVWYETETGSDGTVFQAKWIKQSGKQPGPVYFQGIQYHPLGDETFDLTMYWVDNNVFIQRRNDSNGGNCNYNGTLIDKSNVRGEYYCGSANKSKGSKWTWSAVIDSQSVK